MVVHLLQEIERDRMAVQETEKDLMVVHLLQETDLMVVHFLQVTEKEHMVVFLFQEIETDLMVVHLLQEIETDLMVVHLLQAIETDLMVVHLLLETETDLMVVHLLQEIETDLMVVHLLQVIEIEVYHKNAHLQNHGVLSMKRTEFLPFIHRTLVNLHHLNNGKIVKKIFDLKTLVKHMTFHILQILVNVVAVATLTHFLYKLNVNQVSVIHTTSLFTHHMMVLDHFNMNLVITAMSHIHHKD